MTFSKCSMKLLLIVLISFFLYGCPYESKVSLSKVTEAKIDEKLIGKWGIENKKEKEKNKGMIIINQFNEHELLFLLTEDGKDKIDSYRGFVTSIGKEKFLNFQEIKASYEKRKWLFVNYTIDNDKFVMIVIEEDIFKKKKFGTSKELYEFVKKNLENKDLYDKVDKIVLKRVE